MVILLIVLLLVIFFMIGGFFAYSKLNGTGTEWGDTFFKYTIEFSKKLDEVSSKQSDNMNSVGYMNGLPYGVNKNIRAEFIDIDNDNTPEMITTYKYNDNYGITVYYIENNEVKYYPPQDGKDIVLL